PGSAQQPVRAYVYRPPPLPPPKTTNHLLRSARRCRRSLKTRQRTSRYPALQDLQCLQLEIQTLHGLESPTRSGISLSSWCATFVGATILL
ncbi:hypothetical protein SETIT_9G036200v2, partial [Setaria italica]